MVDKTQRRLAAILAADVAGYTRLVEKDTDGTVAAWAAARDDVVKPLVSEKSGHIIKFTGDGFLVEFPSVQDAVLCAISMQEQLKSSPLDFRMGINVGDVIDDGGDIHGEGVNIAARIEALAEPGGICISGDVYNQVLNRIEVFFDDLGEQEIKHVSRFIRVYAINLCKTDTLENLPTTLHEKPSLAVLPFDNMSGDPEQEYFSDGITEDIITELSRFRSLFIIARNSSFAFKGQAIDITDIAKKLGVQYVVEGSVRKAGERIRITAQLIDATSGNHLWAERYDRSLEDIFDVQDEVASQIATMVPGYVDTAKRFQSERKRTPDLNAYDLMLRAEHIADWDFYSHEIETLLKQVLETDPGYAIAHARLAEYYAYSAFAHGLNIAENAILARDHAETALKLDPVDPIVNALLAETYLLVGKHESANFYMDKAIALNPNDYRVMTAAGMVKAYLGDYEGAVIWSSKAAISDPYSADAVRESFFDAHYLGHQYELALEQMVGWNNPPAHMYLAQAATLAQLERIEEAEESMQQYEKNRPVDCNVVGVMQAYARMCAKSEDADRWLEGFRKAGMEI